MAEQAQEGRRLLKFGQRRGNQRSRKKKVESSSSSDEVDEEIQEDVSKEPTPDPASEEVKNNFIKAPTREDISTQQQSTVADKIMQERKEEAKQVIVPRSAKIQQAFDDHAAKAAEELTLTSLDLKMQEVNKEKLEETKNKF